jgi:hypothetical protein
VEALENDASLTRPVNSGSLPSVVNSTYGGAFRPPRSPFHGLNPSDQIRAPQGAQTSLSGDKKPIDVAAPCEREFRRED